MKVVDIMQTLTH